MQLLEAPTTTLNSLTAEERQLVLAAHARAELLMAGGAPLREVLALLTSAVEALGKGRTVASILVLDRDGLLRNGASPNLPADYLDAIDRLKPDARVGTCAAAAATGEIVDTPNFLDDRRWSELRHLPMALGFVGAWSMPIKNAEGRVLGTFGTYFREHRLATPAEREAVTLLAQLAANAIEANAFA
jgi:GAF domain-containing protein